MTDNWRPTTGLVPIRDWNPLEQILADVGATPAEAGLLDSDSVPRDSEERLQSELPAELRPHESGNAACQDPSASLWGGWTLASVSPAAAPSIA
ncbi:MAG TPA: hypothetical protein VMU49_04955 [Candidatus Acidoferrales bacterium]|nr:hypothetical protein [Candidatus Acidoferrales bacterium]